MDKKRIWWDNFNTTGRFVCVFYHIRKGEDGVDTKDAWMIMELTGDDGKATTSGAGKSEVDRRFGGCKEKTLSRSTDNVRENHIEC